MEDFSELDPGVFWRVLGSRAIGMTLVTSGRGEQRAGLIALSASHVSAAPPTLLVSVDQSTSALATIRDTKAFAVNFLSSVDRPVHDRFHPKSGIKGAERFEAAQWGELKTGSPVLNDAIGAFDCQLLEIIERDGIAICLGRAVAARVGDGDPLVYFKGKFGGWVGPDL